MDSTEDGLEHVEVLSVRPGDTIIVRCDSPVSMQHAEEIKHRVKAQLTIDVPVLVLGAGWTISVARPSVNDTHLTD